MTDKEFKQLKRNELIDIIFEYQKQEAELREEISQLKEQLNNRNDKIISDAKVIAEVVKNMGVILNSTQQIADNYLASVYEKGQRIGADLEHLDNEEG